MEIEVQKMASMALEISMQTTSFARMGMKHMETGGIIIVVSSCNSEAFA
jgi:hypothetical protein